MNKLFDVNPEEATRLVLVRHGRTASNAAGRIQGRADVPLDPTGLDEAHAVARALRRFGAAALYTSPADPGSRDRRHHRPRSESGAPGVG